MPKLILARHGATPYNEAGIWTGLTDIDMSEEGYREIEKSAAFIAQYEIDIALCSKLKRARNTAKVILRSQGDQEIPLLETELLNEKDYGAFTGKNKQHVKTEVGEDRFAMIRRSWDYKIEGGESLQEVYERVVPVHKKVVLPLLETEHTVLISSHNNTLRAYVKELEKVPDEKAHLIELGTAEVRVYDFMGGAISYEDRYIVGEVH